MIYRHIPLKLKGEDVVRPIKKTKKTHLLSRGELNLPEHLGKSPLIVQDFVCVGQDTPTSDVIQGGGAFLALPVQQLHTLTT